MLSATRPSLARVILPRRCIHTSTDDARQLLRRLLRETAQSVAVVTALLPDPSTSTYHGATLSSFSSIALDPLPLVAFSLRVPSRMASALSSNFNLTTSESPPPLSPTSPPPTPTPTPLPSPSPPAHLLINILSAAQPHVADRFARPDLHPRPFDDPRVRYTLSQDNLPILAGSLGALSCRLVGPSLSLAHLRDSHAVLDEDEDERRQSMRMREGEGSGGTALASELFIARVLRVERVPFLEDDQQDRTGLHTLPLLYHRRRYTTVGDDMKS